MFANSQKEFVSWMRSTGNMFTGEEYHLRYGVWLANKRIVQEHNAALFSFTLAMNKLSHLTQAEYNSLLGFRIPIRERKTAKPTNYKAPESIDWRAANVVNPIKDQASCGSCWAFSSTQALESALALKNGKLYDFSEQNLVSCVTECAGCNGGYMKDAYDYLVNDQNGKISLQKDYPYTATDGRCTYNPSKAIRACSGYMTVVEDSEEDLANKCALYGPVAVAIDASHFSFQLYGGGIYDEPRCSPLAINHAVGLVGYGFCKEHQKAYWLVRNSWGVGWGEKGYVKMVKDKNNQCGIASDACIPTTP